MSVFSGTISPATPCLRRKASGAMPKSTDQMPNRRGFPAASGFFRSSAFRMPFFPAATSMTAPLWLTWPILTSGTFSDRASSAVASGATMNSERFCVR